MAACLDEASPLVMAPPVVGKPVDSASDPRAAPHQAWRPRRRAPSEFCVARAHFLSGAFAADDHECCS